MFYLNCDLGEETSCRNIHEVMPFIDMANISCGFHSGNPLLIEETVQKALNYGVSIGAHPSYPDRQGFGRRSMHVISEDLQAMIIYQIGALDALVRAHEGTISYVKPHGALYNDMMCNEHVFINIARAVARYDKELKLVLLANRNCEKYQGIAKEYEIKLLYEVFADRTYNDDGSLLARDKAGAVISDEMKVLGQVEHMIKYSTITTISGKKYKIAFDTICIHGDNPEVFPLVKKIHVLLGHA